MKQTVDFDAIFATVKMEEVESVMREMVEQILKAGYRRLNSEAAAAKVASEPAKGEVKKTQPKQSRQTAKKESTTKGASKASRSKVQETEGSKTEAQTEKTTKEDRISTRIKLIQMCKPGMTVEVKVWDYKAKKHVVKDVVIPKKSALKKLKLEKVDYSDNSFVVIGDTKEIKDYFNYILGGTFNSRLSCGAGWVFAKNRQWDEIAKALAI